jgi:hypothetical protein
MLVVSRFNFNGLAAHPFPHHISRVTPSGLQTPAGFPVYGTLLKNKKQPAGFTAWSGSVFLPPNIPASLRSVSSCENPIFLPLFSLRPLPPRDEIPLPISLSSNLSV